MAPNNSRLASPLLHDDDNDVEKDYLIPPNQSLPRSRKTLSKGILIVSLGLNVIFFVHIFLYPLRTTHVKWKGDLPMWCRSHLSHFMYPLAKLPSRAAPAESAITHKRQLFMRFTEGSIYSGPGSVEVDRAWSDLYEKCTLS